MSLNINLNSPKSASRPNSSPAFPLRNKTPLRPTANSKQTQSPKSVSSYLKDFNDKSKPKANLNEINSSNERKSITINKSLKAKADSCNVNDGKSDDPTTLISILTALKSSSKGHLPYPEPIHTLDDANEVCDFKFIGNLNHISFSPGNSFRDDSCGEEYEDEANEVPAIKYEDEEAQTSFSKSHRLDEERSIDSSSDEDSEYLDRFNQMSIIFDKVKLETKRTNEAQIKSIQKRDEYINKLLQIRESAANSLRLHQATEKQYQLQEEKRREQQKLAIEHEAILIQEKYLTDVKQRRAEIVKEIELADHEAAKKEAHKKDLIQILEEPLSIFKIKLSQGQSEGKHLQPDSELHKILFEQLPAIYDSTGKLIERLNASPSPDAEKIQLKLNQIMDAIKIIEDVQRLIKESNEPVRQIIKHEDTNPPQYDQHFRSQEGSHIKIEPLSEAEQLDIEPLVTEIQSEDHPKHIKPFQESQKFYNYLKLKFLHTSEEANEVKKNVNLRPLLARAVGIINQLNNDRHDSSNRGKLQQIFNLVSGRICIFGNENISTQNNPSAQAFVKEQLASKIITLSHDKQVSSMAIYASLIVRLWQLYPDVGELIIFKLFETCPFLVPLTIRREASQGEEEFYRSLGFRHKDGGTREAIDKYLTRMGSAAQLYGRIISMDVEKHPHGIEHGWKWLAKILTMPPYPNVTAALLYGFLNTAGCALLQRYRRQFCKLLHFLCMSYFSQIESETLEGGHSDVVGMKKLLQDYQKTGRISPPEEGYKLLL